MPTVTAVTLAPAAPGNTGPSALVDDRHRTLVDGDTWLVLTTATQVAHVLDALRSTAAGRHDVLAALQLAGYWPTAKALHVYLAGRSRP